MKHLDFDQLLLRYKGRGQILSPRPFNKRLLLLNRYKPIRTLFKLLAPLLAQPDRRLQGVEYNVE